MNIVMYSKTPCVYCDNARYLLNSKGITFTERKLGEDFTREFLLESYPSAKTFPVIVVDGFHIGGFTELKKLFESNQMPGRLLTEGEWNGA